MSATGFDVCVSGSGAVAMSLTLALSAEGWRVAWARSPEATSPAKADVRTYALNARAITLLERLRVWPALKAFSSPVFEMKICGDGGGALSFSAWQQQVTELAWIVDAAALERLLGEALRFAPRVEIVPPLQGAQAPVKAALLAICEGKFSDARRALGVSFDRQPYGHSGVAAPRVATRAHHGVARAAGVGHRRARIGVERGADGGAQSFAEGESVARACAAERDDGVVAGFHGDSHFPIMNHSIFKK